jgi:hypothetical protein
MATEDLLHLFRLPMSRPAYNEFVLFKEELEPLRNDTDQKDIWVWHWTGGLYTSRMFYKQHFKDVLAPAPFSWIWKAKCMPKINFFAWLLLVDRLNTRYMLRRRHKHLEEGYHCELCPEQVDETSMHLFFECTSSTARWYVIGIQWENQGSIVDMLHQQRHSFQGPYFMDLFMIAAWCI